MPDDNNLKEDLIEMKSRPRLHLLFNKLKLEVTVVFSFSTTYFCESGFSTMMYIKNKYRNRLQLEDDLRIVWSKTKPSLKRILKMTRQQKSG